MNNTTPLLQADHLTVHHGTHAAIKNVSFALQPAEIVTIVGPNGSGKTTLLRTIIGALQPDSGRLTRRPDMRIGYVPQKLSIDPTLPLNVARFLSLPKRRSPEEIKEALSHAGASGLINRQMVNLSGGQFQRVLLARAVLEKPHLLILDEQTTWLDHPGSAVFYRQFERVRGEV